MDAHRDQPYETALAWAALGFALKAKHDAEGAISAFEQAGERLIAARGHFSADLPPSLNERAELYIEVGRLDDAETVLTQSIGICQRSRAAAPYNYARAQASLARVQASQGRMPEALATVREATASLVERTAAVGGLPSASALLERQGMRGIFSAHVGLLYDAYGRSSGRGADESFVLAQRAQISAVGDALERMAARFAVRNDALGRLIRRRQDRVGTWRKVDDDVRSALGRPELRSASLSALEDQLLVVSGEINDVDRQLRERFPAFAQLTNPKPASIGEVQQLLSPNQALLLQLTTAKATYLWLVRRNTRMFVRTDLSEARLAELVSSIRTSLWTSASAGADRLDGFDFDSAHALYQGLLEPLAAELTGVDHLYVVSEGAPRLAVPWPSRL